MSNQLTSNAEALRLFFTEDVYLLKNEFIAIAEPNAAISEPQKFEEANHTSKLDIVETSLPLVSLPSIQKVQIEKKYVFEYLGKNQKGILILVNDLTNKVSTQQGTELLRKLVKAIELTNNDFALVNYAAYSGAAFHDLAQFFNCNLVLSFGVTPKHLNISDYSMHILHQHENIKIIFSKNLHDLDTDPASKKTLWGSLQQLK